MADKTIKVPAGSTVEINLKRRKRPALAPTAEAGEAPGIIPVESDPTRYVRREQAFVEITFYDWGTRLQPDGSYIDLDFGHITSYVQLQAMLLDGEPFGTTVIDGEEKPNCLRLPQSATWLYVDALFRSSGDVTVAAARHDVLAPPHSRNQTDRLTSAPQNLPTSSRWSAQGVLKLPRTGIFGVQSLWYYRALYPSTLLDRLPGKKWRVYLRPRLYDSNSFSGTKFLRLPVASIGISQLQPFRDIQVVEGESGFIAAKASAQARARIDELIGADWVSIGSNFGSSLRTGDFQSRIVDDDGNILSPRESNSTFDQPYEVFGAGLFRD